MNRWLDQPNPGESFDQWLQTAECQRLLDNLPSLPAHPDYDPEPGPSARECTADRLYHEAIEWAANNEPDTCKRRLLIREAYTSPEMAAWHARAHGYAQAVEDCGQQLQQAMEERDALGSYLAAMSRAGQRQRQQHQAARERLLAALYRAVLVALVCGGLLILGVAQRWVRGW